MRKLCPSTQQQCDCGEAGASGPDCPHPVTFDYYWLVEMKIDRVQFLNPCYWAGRENRVVKSPRGVEVTTDPNRARKIPLDAEELAVDIAAVLNTYYPVKREDGGLPWAAVQHGFAR